MAALEFHAAVNQRTRQLATTISIWLGIAASATFLYLFNPANSVFFPQCPFRTLTGWQCPGCGSTRGMYQLLHGHFVAAFELNPLMVLTLPLVLYGLFVFTKSSITGKPPRQIFIPPKFMWAGLALILFFWVFRNTRWYPFVS